MKRQVFFCGYFHVLDFVLKMCMKITVISVDVDITFHVVLLPLCDKQ